MCVCFLICLHFLSQFHPCTRMHAHMYTHKLMHIWCLLNVFFDEQLDGCIFEDDEEIVKSYAGFHITDSGERRSCWFRLPVGGLSAYT